MDNKIPNYYLFDIIKERWSGVSVVVQDIDEIKTNIMNYSNKVSPPILFCHNNH